ncbi:MAG: hypothetical protein M1834_009377 [Cirrosporium novae-zelandiae]|nr:MAG: hypothetical protein M1834_009377 [Cirrosporium novae-zelandiae]
MYRCIFYFHHIYSSKKIKILHQLAQKYRLTGIMKTNRPGFLYALTREGQKELENFIVEVKGMRWQEARVKYVGEVWGPHKDSSSEDPVGFKQVEKMSEFSKWMHEKGLGDVLKESVVR